MNYSLSATRNIGGYKQKIVLQQTNGGFSNISILNNMRAWCNKFYDIDPQDRAVGSFEYYNYIQTPSDLTDNTGVMADVAVTVLSTTNGSNPKHTTFIIEDCTINNFISNLTTEYTLLTGLTITNITEYLLTATIKLKSLS